MEKRLSITEQRKAACDPAKFSGMRLMLDFISQPQQSCLAKANKRCWLCEDVATWNRLVHAFGYEFSETRPGALTFRAIPYATDSEIYQDAATAASIASKLLSLHACIDEIDIFYSDYAMLLLRPDWAGLSSHIKQIDPFPVRPNFGVRHVKARTDCHGGVSLREVLNLHLVISLETLVLDRFDIGYASGSRIASAVEFSVGTLKEFAILNSEMAQESSDDICRKLRKCFHLRSASLKYRITDLESVGALVGLVNFSKSTTFQKIEFPTLVAPEHVAQIAETLATNTCLREVYLSAPALSLTPVFVAFEANATVQHLHLSCGAFDDTETASLASMLRMNTGLRSLTLEGVDVTEPAAKQLSRGLRENVTLKRLGLPSTYIDAAAVICLCRALQENTVLQELTFGDFYASEKERAELAAVLAETGGYGRARLPLMDAHIPAMSSLLTQQPERPMHLTLGNICAMSTTLLEQLCEALARSTMVHSLKVHYAGHSPSNGIAFTEMLEVNTSITSLQLSVRSEPGTYCLATKVAGALVSNRTLQELTTSGDILLPRKQTIKSFARLLSWNDTITKMVISAIITRKLVGLLAPGMKRNKTILEFGAACSPVSCTDDAYPLFETLRRNRIHLNHAVEFVQGDRDRERLKAFDHLYSKRHLQPHVVQATGWTELEAQQRISAGVRFIRSNFFVHAGVVQHSVQCHPVQGTTQIDALNTECWIALARYLKLSDIPAAPAPYVNTLM